MCIKRFVKQTTDIKGSRVVPVFGKRVANAKTLGTSVLDHEYGSEVVEESGHERTVRCY